MNGSIVRRGNHFIRLENEWCLIDGPWFDSLERLSRGGSIPIHLPYSDHMEMDLVWDSDEAPRCSYKEVEWLPKAWYPAYHNPWKAMVWARWEELYLQDRWNKWIAGRRRRGYMLLPDGELPEFLNRQAPKDADRDWWYDAWNWYQ